MIKKLQRKFIAIAMCSIALVLTIIMIGINIANYMNVCKNADMRILMISGKKEPAPPREKDSGTFFGDYHALSSEAAFDTRFFTVTLQEDGEVSQIDTGKISAVSTSDASAYATLLYEKNKTSGFIGCYRYKAVLTPNDTTMYIFVDSERELYTFQMFLYASIGISLAGLLLVFILVVFLSRRIMKPVAESYEKQRRFITDASHEIKTPPYYY